MKQAPQKQDFDCQMMQLKTNGKTTFMRSRTATQNTEVGSD
jgi:hypothetical protein